MYNNGNHLSGGIFPELDYWDFDAIYEGFEHIDGDEFMFPGRISESAVKKSEGESR